MPAPITPIETESLSALLNRYRERHGITSDERLAAALGVSDVAIYRWRKGQINKSALILAALILELHPECEYSTAA
jgi:transcriptional regulator with XRE-family HTH domain